MNAPLPPLPILARYLALLVLAVAGFANGFSSRGRATWAVGIAAATLLVHASLFAPYTVDDSFITFRYSRNWAEGLGPIYQPHERVEGYTSFLWTALLALSHRFGFDIERASKALGGLCALATLPALAGLVEELAPRSRAVRLAPVLIALTPLFAAWTFAGMDALLFAAVLTWAARLLMREQRLSAKLPWSAVLFAVLVLTRPEGALFAAAAWALRVFESRRAGRWNGAIQWAVVFSALVVPYWIWRWNYFGAFFPNTFYAKTTLSFWRLVNGAHSLLDFGVEVGLASVLLVLIAALTGPRDRTGFLFVCGSLLAFLFYVFAVGGDVLYLRFYVHVLPLWIALVAMGLEDIAEALSDRAPAWARGTGVAALLGLIWTIPALAQDDGALAGGTHFGATYVVDNSNHIHRAHLPLGRWLHDHADPAAHVAVTDIGGIGYESRLPTIDLYGLTDRPIAMLIHRKASPAMLAAHIRARDPEYIVLYGTSHGPSLGWLTTEKDWFQHRYVVHSFWPDSPQDKGLVLLVRADVNVPAASAPGVSLLGSTGRN